MKRYLNLKTNYGVETIEELDLKDFENRRELIREKNRLIREYWLCGMNVYTSQRCDKTWNNK